MQIIVGRRRCRFSVAALLLKTGTRRHGRHDAALARGRWLWRRTRSQAGAGVSGQRRAAEAFSYASACPSAPSIGGPLNRRLSPTSAPIRPAGRTPILCAPQRCSSGLLPELARASGLLRRFATPLRPHDPFRRHLLLRASETARDQLTSTASRAVAASALPAGRHDQVEV